MSCHVLTLESVHWSFWEENVSANYELVVWSRCHWWMEWSNTVCMSSNAKRHSFSVKLVYSLGISWHLYVLAVTWCYSVTVVNVSARQQATLQACHVMNAEFISCFVKVWDILTMCCVGLMLTICVCIVAPSVVSRLCVLFQLGLPLSCVCVCHVTCSGALCSQSAVCTVSARPASELCVFCAVSRDSYGCWRSSEAHWGWRQLRQNADNCDCVRRWVVTAAVMSSVSHLCLSSAITKPRCVVVDRETKSV